MPRDFVVRMYTVPTTYHAHPRSTRRYPQYVVPTRIQKSSNAKQQNHVTHATATEQPSDCAHSLSNASHAAVSVVEQHPVDLPWLQPVVDDFHASHDTALGGGAFP